MLTLCEVDANNVSMVTNLGNLHVYAHICSQ